MAIIEQGILGAFRGKCGNVIGYVRNGVACMRSMPSHYRDRKSEAQLRNRGRFTMVMKMMSVVRPAITLGFRRFASSMTEMNVATRVNYYSLVKEGGASFEYDFSGLVLSRGGVEGLVGVMLNVVGSSVNLVWDGGAVWGGAEDVVSVVLVNGDRMRMKFYRDVALRGDGGVSVEVPHGWNGEGVYCYVMVSRGTDWSESLFVGGLNGVGVAVLSEGDGVSSDSEFDSGSERVVFGSNQSALKVLLKLGQLGVEKGEEIPPDGVKKRGEGGS